MAGDYIPITDELQGRREVGIIARATNRDILGVLGGLQVFWLWAQKETATGSLPGLVLDDLPRMIPLLDRSFFEALTRPDVKWLVVKADGLLIPRFSRWLGNAAKKRLKERDKKRRQRDREPRESVPKMSPRNRDTGGDKRGTTAGPERNVNDRVREEEEKNPTLNVGHPPDEEGPEEANAARKAMREFLVDQILEETRDHQNRNCYRRIVHRLHPGDVQRALSETRAARLANEITTNPARYFMGRAMSIADDRGVDLGFKPGPRRARAA